MMTDEIEKPQLPPVQLKDGSGVTYTRNLILRGICAIYLIAFVTFYYQSPGKLIYYNIPVFKQLASRSTLYMVVCIVI